MRDVAAHGLVENAVGHGVANQASQIHNADG